MVNHQNSILGPVFAINVGFNMENVPEGITYPDVQSIALATLNNFTEEHTRDNYTFTLNITARVSGDTWTVTTHPFETIAFPGAFPTRHFRFATAILEEGNNFVPERGVIYDVELRIADEANNRIIVIEEYSLGHALDATTIPIAPCSEGYSVSMGGFTIPEEGLIQQTNFPGRDTRALALNLPTDATHAGAHYERTRWVMNGLTRAVRQNWEIRIRTADGSFETSFSFELNQAPNNFGPIDVIHFRTAPRPQQLRFDLDLLEIDLDLPEGDLIVTIYVESQTDANSNFRLGMFTAADVGAVEGDDNGNAGPGVDEICSNCGRPILECMALCGDDNDGGDFNWLLWGGIGRVVALLVIGGAVFVVISKGKKN
jgi:hypothetical protein